MGSGDGGIIIGNDAVRSLSNPVIHGQLPATITGSLDPVLVKDCCDWSETERDIVASAMAWAIRNVK